MKVGIASDHGGQELKNKIIKYLTKNSIEYIDLSTDNNPLDDYPEYAFRVGEKISNKKIDYGILCCYTGIGISIAANKVRGVRCAKPGNVKETMLARKHNDANIIAFAHNARNYEKMIEIFLNTPFSNEERHVRRIEMIKKYETGEYNEL